jgi:hypothetical protein
MRQFPKKLRAEFSVFKNLTTVSKIQDFLDNIPINFEENGDTCRSPRESLLHNKVHCMEGALLAAAALWYHGKKPILLDLKTTDEDESHVVTLFRESDRWGAISKTNHAVLRYRDPIFKTVRELALSYFNEYFLDNGEKTLRSFAGPFSLLPYGDEWLVSKDQLWQIVNEIDEAPHQDILPKKTIPRLRLADQIEIKAGKLTEWKNKK